MNNSKSAIFSVSSTSSTDIQHNGYQIAQPKAITFLVNFLLKHFSWKFLVFDVCSHFLPSRYTTTSLRMIKNVNNSALKSPKTSDFGGMFALTLRLLHRRVQNSLWSDLSITFELKSINYCEESKALLILCVTISLTHKFVFMKSKFRTMSPAN